MKLIILEGSALGQVTANIVLEYWTVLGLGYQDMDINSVLGLHVIKRLQNLMIMGFLISRLMISRLGFLISRCLMMTMGTLGKQLAWLVNIHMVALQIRILLLNRSPECLGIGDIYLLLL